MRVGTTLAVALLLAATAGCGSSAPEGEHDGDHASEGFSAAADLTTCTGQATPADQPYGERFPSDWPFPPGTVVFNAEDRGSDGTIVTGVTSTPFRRVLAFMNHDVVGAGYRTEQGETEEHDAEAEWDGHGFRGRWAIRESASCPGETVLQVVSTRE
ncbi:MAG: hypothetical protein HOQ22_07430 [Nocardioidaceae bacterium]|nr:hypothetical protein [Nocardioidaceae bacterium]NUS50858.1 hypothetical protein [Nocardioidaceae bacterium]